MAKHRHQCKSHGHGCISQLICMVSYPKMCTYSKKFIHKLLVKRYVWCHIPADIVHVQNESESLINFYYVGF